MIKIGKLPQDGVFEAGLWLQVGAKNDHFFSFGGPQTLKIGGISGARHKSPINN